MAVEILVLLEVNFQFCLSFQIWDCKIRLLVRNVLVSFCVFKGGYQVGKRVFNFGVVHIKLSHVVVPKRKLKLINKIIILIKNSWSISS